MMNIISILTEFDYDAALGEASGYFDQPPEAGSPEAERFVALLSAIEHYEAVHYPISPPGTLKQA